MATRQEVYGAIDSERDYQNQKWRRPTSSGTDGHNPHSVTEWLTYIVYYANEGLKAETLAYDANVAVDFLRKVAALGVAGMEQHGAPRRDI